MPEHVQACLGRRPPRHRPVDGWGAAQPGWVGLRLQHLPPLSSARWSPKYRPRVRAAAPKVCATARAQRWGPRRGAAGAARRGGRRPGPGHPGHRRRAAGLPRGKSFETWAEDKSSVPLPTQVALRTLERVCRTENMARLDHRQPPLHSGARAAGRTTATRQFRKVRERCHPLVRSQRGEASTPPEPCRAPQLRAPGALEIGRSPDARPLLAPLTSASTGLALRRAGWRQSP